MTEICGWALASARAWETIDGRVRLVKASPGPEIVAQIMNVEDSLLIEAAGCQKIGYRMYLMLETIRASVDLVHDIIGCQRRIRVNQRCSGYALMQTRHCLEHSTHAHYVMLQRTLSKQWRFKRPTVATHPTYVEAIRQLYGTEFPTRRAALTALNDVLDKP